jgi:hypothetical protein
MTEQDAIAIAKADDAYRVRRDFITKHPELSKIPSSYSELMPASTDQNELGTAAEQILQKYQTELAPMQAAQRVDQEAQRRAKLKADLIAAGMPEGQADYSANLQMPSEGGYSVADINDEVQKLMREGNALNTRTP